MREPSRVASVFIYRAGARRIPELEPLWHALYDHHVEIGQSVAPLRDFGESWRRRRAQYEAWLQSDDALLLVAMTVTLCWPFGTVAVFRLAFHRPEEASKLMGTTLPLSTW